MRKRNSTRTDPQQEKREQRAKRAEDTPFIRHDSNTDPDRPNFTPVCAHPDSCAALMKNAGAVTWGAGMFVFGLHYDLALPLCQHPVLHHRCRITLLKNTTHYLKYAGKQGFNNNYWPLLAKHEFVLDRLIKQRQKGKVFIRAALKQM
jgi:hypothetical protein